MQLGLCCAFENEPIIFRRITAGSLERLDRKDRVIKLRALCSQNAAALHAAITYCSRHGIGCFRVTSRILPLRTHPRLGYDAELIGEETVAAFRRCKDLARRHSIRLTFHPDQFVVLSSLSKAVVESSLKEIESHAEVAGWIGADVINIHGGGGFGDKRLALERMEEKIGCLSHAARSLLTIENDDRIFTPADLLPLCRKLGLPLVYDVHHHRCRADGLNVEAATKLAVNTWNRRPLFHVSSPREGWHGKNPSRHADYISLRDFPALWEEMDCTVEVEAKAKELALSTLAKALRRRARRKGISG